MSIKAIETVYNGYRFRSRLEARWALFFDKLGLPWEYEPEGFDLGAQGWYLPDFRVMTPQGNVCWYEIKPKHVKDDPKFRAFRDSMQSEFEDFLMTNAREPGKNHVETAPRCVLLSGDPMDVFDEGLMMCPRCGVIDKPISYARPHEHGCDNSGPIFSCYPCDCETPIGGYHPPEPGMFGLMVSQHKGLLFCYSWKEKDMGADYYDALVHPIFLAKQRARAARFEHGEQPRATA